MTAAKRLVTVGLAVLAILGGSERRSFDSEQGSAGISGPVATLAAQSTAPVAELVADIRSGGGSGPTGFRVFKDALYFSANDGINGRELWRLDATGAATMVADINPAGSSSPSQLTATVDWLYFVATTPDEGAELWRYDGVNPPSPAANVNPGATGGDLAYLTSYGNQVVFRANDGATGDELFSFDAVNGLKRFDIEKTSASCPFAPDCESSPFSLTVYDGILYFSAFETGAGFQLYSYDGTTYNRLTNNIGGATAITGLGNRLIFGGFDFGQYRVYSYDIGSGSGVATKLSDATVRNTGTLSQDHPVVFNNRVYFAANDGINGEELWSSDGTVVGTGLAADVNTGPGSSLPKWLTVFNGELYFEATDPTSGLEPRAFNGSSTRLVADVITGSSGGRFEGPAILGSNVIFQGIATGLRPLYTTGAGASVVEKSGGGQVSIDDPEFTFFNGALYFSGSDSPTGTPSNDELWRITLTAKTPTTTTLVSSLNPSVFSDLVTFTATVTGTSPTGTVTFLDGTTPLGTVSLSGGLASFSTSTLGPGNHTITARYEGDANSAPSTSPDLIQVVNKIATTTTLISSLNPSIYTETVTFTATVSPVSGTEPPAGGVTFFDGTTGLATVALVGNTATFQIATLNAGAHSITASYAGSVIHEPSTSNAVEQTVTKLLTTTTLSSSPEPSIVGETVTFSAAVAGWFPTGEVTFSEGGVTLGSAMLVMSAAGHIATFQTSALTVAVHTITATYAGDTNHSGSAAGDNHTVNAPFPPTPPVANSQSPSVSEDTPTVITVTASDVNNDPLTYQVTSPPLHGTLTGTPPSLTYTPNLNYNGLDGFSFKANDGTADSNVATVSITVTPVNDAPVAVNDGYTTAEDTALIVTVPGVMANDSDVDSSPITVSVVTSTVHGVLVLNPNGSFSYTPMPNFFGADGFTYRVSDGQLTSDIVPVSIAVTPVNDVPAAVNDNYTTNEGQALTIAAPGVLANDTDVEASPLTATQASGPSNGVLTLNGNGSFTYTPGSNFTGSDTFTYRASDGVTPSNVATVTISVVPRTFTWTATGVLGTRRRAHTATLLPNGKVLVTGGYGQGNSAMNNAELYDPLTGIWGPVNSMRVRRAFHTATLLPNGHVLVAGGENNGLVTRTETYDPATGIWTEAGLLNAVHSRHTATLLLSGRVLVVGGYDNSGSLGGAELFDPATRTWTPTGSLGVGRHFQTATLLPDGRVLAVGGFGTNGAVNSAELYNPGSGTWSTTASLSTNRTGHTATLLGNGKVLIVGGGNNSSPTLATTELFDPINDTWTIGPSSVTARISHTATVLPSGRVLVAGGNTAAGGLHIASEIFDPTTGQWSFTASLIAARAFHTATLLADGRVLAAGGLGALNSAELYGPAAGPSVGRWDPAGSMSLGRYGHTATLLSDGRVLVAGGSGDNSAEIFDPATGAWTMTGSMNVARSFHTAALMPTGKVLVAGGLSVGIVIPAEVYDPATGAWTITGSPSLARIDATATLLPANRGVLLAGGAGISGVTNTSETYNLTSQTWSSAGSFTGARARHGATQLADGRVLLTGGFGSGGNPYLSSAVIYDAAFFTWTDAASMTTRRSRHGATLLPDGRVLVSGGVTKAGTIVASELFDPATGTWATTGNLASARAYHSSTLLPNGKVLVAGGVNATVAHQTSELYDPATGTWSATGNLGAARQFHTATLLPNGKVLVVGGFSSSVAAFATAEFYTP